MTRRDAVSRYPYGPEPAAPTRCRARLERAFRRVPGRAPDRRPRVRAGAPARARNALRRARAASPRPPPRGRAGARRGGGRQLVPRSRTDRPAPEPRRRLGLRPRAARASRRRARACTRRPRGGRVRVRFGAGPRRRDAAGRHAARPDPAGARRGGRARRARRVACPRRLRARGTRRRPGPDRGSWGHRRRLPEHGPGAAPRRFLRRRDRARTRVLALHAAHAPPRSRRGRVPGRGATARSRRGQPRRRPRVAGAAVRPRRASRPPARHRLGAGRRAPGLGRGLAGARSDRRRDGARPLPAGAEALVRGAASGDRCPRPRRGGKRAGDDASPGPAGPRRLPAPGRSAPHGAAVAPGGSRARRRGPSAHTRPVRPVRGQPGSPRVRLEGSRAGAAAGRPGLPQAAASGGCPPRPRPPVLRGSPHRGLHRPRGPRRRPAARLRDEGGRRRHARLPLPRLPRRGPALRPARAVAEGQPLHRGGCQVAHAVEARRQGLGQPQESGTRLGSRARG